MNQRTGSVVETLELAHGLEVDLDEGWRKLIARQFSGDPGRAFCELIQNFLDSYPSSVPCQERTAEIVTASHSVSLTDHGEGMDRRRLELLVTLGGTDKRDDPSKIGRFGIGFFSIFNPALETRRVKVTTCCEGQPVELVFEVEDPDKRPRLHSRVLEGDLSFSTRVEVEFGNDASPRRCLAQAERYLEYYPCRVLVDGRPFASVWERARSEGATFFAEGSCEGFLEQHVYGEYAKILCKYERIFEAPLLVLGTGGHSPTQDLRDYQRRNLPHLPGVHATVNCNDLSVTISRDSFWLDAAYERMVRALAGALGKELRRRLASDGSASLGPTSELVVANQFTLLGPLTKHFGKLEQSQAVAENQSTLLGALKKQLGKLAHSLAQEDDDERALCRLLAEAKVYRISGRPGAFSLLDLARMRSRDLPLFYAPEQRNLRWLGGDFKHDFVVLPPHCHPETPQLYDKVFAAVFDDVVNLDTAPDDAAVLGRLCKRGIVTAEMLAPKTRLRDELEISPPEGELLREIGQLLAQPTVQRTIASALHLPVRSIGATYFEVRDEGVRVATGLFTEDGRHVGAAHEPEAPGDYLIGLCASDPLIRQLVESRDPQRAYYSLAYLAHQLTGCQERLVPHTRFFHHVRQTLCERLRRAMIDQLLTDHDGAPERDPDNLN